MCTSGTKKQDVQRHGHALASHANTSDICATCGQSNKTTAEALAYGQDMLVHTTSDSTCKDPVARQLLQSQTCDVLRALATIPTQHRNAYFLAISPAGICTRVFVHESFLRRH